MRLLPGPDTRAAILKHPFVLAGLAVVALLGLTAGALVAVDSARDNATVSGVTIDPVTTATRGPIARTAVASGVQGTTNTTTAVRLTPGSRGILGTLPRNTSVEIDGRSTDANWLRIVFPPRSELHGWVDAEQLDLEGDRALLAIVAEEPPVVVDVPTQIPPELTPEVSATPSPEGSATPDGLPDLVIGTTATLADGKLFVSVVNQGSGDATGDLVVAVFNADQTALIGGATVPGFTLEAGRSIDVGTGYEVIGSQTLLLIVDPNGDIEESDNTNNQISIAISVEDMGEPEPIEPVPPPEAP
jgi:hypothetical protein